MLYSVSGILELVEPYHVVVECGGIGYSVKTSMTTVSGLPAIGSPVKLYTHLSVREDALDLFGFSQQQELEAFKLLISVSGVGPKAAVSILSSLTPDRLALSVAAGDVKALKAPGVGPKIAQRILLELKDKLSGGSAGAVGAPSLEAAPIVGNASEAISALEALGYSRGDAAQAISKLEPDTSVEEMIKYGLKALAAKL
ncbi:MAG: Holliday junction branch migration protein RuvA [Oscillospiraceae bacterium]|jgi:Holliday junction DNA helicase RuvA|nr:Holliday junction branch migration protein RuvA [Oscillospiraceae bacterium]